ncbi:MAG: hypothetical protein AAGD22_03525 [Verrucomicrobiota bacterium]
MHRTLSQLTILTLTLVFSSLAHAGEMIAYEKSPVTPAPPTTPERPFADARRPISNPTLFDLAIPQTLIHPIIAYHRLPGAMNTILGDVPVGGHVEVYALQLEIALNERLSINAVKDGYIRFRPDQTLTEISGWANVGAGVKYAWLYKPEENLAANFQLVYEIPMGNQKVFQGSGDGKIIPSLNFLKLWDRWQVADQFGFEIPLDGDAESSVFYNSFHISYAVTDWLFPMFEANVWTVMSTGDGGQRFNDQVGGAIPSLVTFEGHDLFNFGASNGDINGTLVTFALGARLRVPNTDTLDLGFGWEFPVTSDSKSVIRDRFYFDAVYRF